MEFRYNGLFRALSLFNGILFLGIVISNFLNKTYFEGFLELVIGVIWVLYYFYFRRPYIEITGRKLILNRGLGKTVEFKLDYLEMLKHNDSIIVFRYLHMNKFKKVKIYFGYLNYEDNLKMKEVFRKLNLNEGVRAFSK